jgi:hypothetical protein
MIWFTWRQFRTQTWITIAALAVLGVLLVVTGRGIADAWNAAGADACGADCANAFDNFLQEIRGGTTGNVYRLAMVLAYVAPALIGGFWGAPLIARELETGTHRLAWNQSVTRTRWLATKLVMIGGTTAAATGLLSWAVTAWAGRIDDAAADRITPLVYGARGIVPVGYALFAFMLGVTAGVLIRRTVAAMAATLAVYAAAVAVMQLWIREHLGPASHTTEPLDVSSLESMGFSPDTGQMRVIGGDLPSGAWVLSNQTVTPTGELFEGPVNTQYCGRGTGPQACEEWLGTLGLRQDLVYHPASNFWPLQWAETGILVAAAVLLAGFCFWWVRRRLA